MLYLVRVNANFSFDLSARPFLLYRTALRKMYKQQSDYCSATSSKPREKDSSSITSSALVTTGDGEVVQPTSLLSSGQHQQQLALKSIAGSSSQEVSVLTTNCILLSRISTLFCDHFSRLVPLPSPTYSDRQVPLLSRSGANHQKFLFLNGIRTGNSVPSSQDT